MCGRKKSMKNTIIGALLFALMLIIVSGAFADDDDKKMAVGLGLEWNMNSRENFGGGIVLDFDYALPYSMAVGAVVGGSHNFSNSGVMEISALYRWYFLMSGHTGFFAQADAGIHLIFENDETIPNFMGGLRGGFRLPLGSLFYIEPYGRIGYPFAFGIGAVAGIRF